MAASDGPSVDPCGLPPDILCNICELASSDDAAHGGAAPSMLATCSQWNRALKSQLSELSPAYLDEPSPLLDGFKSVRTLRVALMRPGVPPMPMRHPVMLPNLFPALTSVDLSRHVLPAGLLAALAERHGSRLQSLTLEGCHITPPDLRQILQFAQLCSLNMAGLGLYAPAEAAPPPGLPSHGPDTHSGSAPQRPANSSAQGAKLPWAIAAHKSADPAAAAAAATTNGLDCRSLPACTTTSTCEAESAPAELLRCAGSRLANLSCLRVDQWPTSTASATSRPHTAGISSTGQVCHLSHLSRLASLSLLDQALSDADLHHLGACTHLTALHLTWPSAPASTSAATSRWDASVARLTNLESLTLVFREDGHERLTVAPLQALTKLVMTGCSSSSLALSVGALTRLQQLSLAHAGPQVPPELVVHLLARLSRLQHLDLSFCRFACPLQLAGDVVMRGVVTVASPSLRTVVMDGVPLHGTGFSALAETPALMSGRPSQVTELVISANVLMRSKYEHMALLSGLQSLTLSHMSAQAFARASMLKCCLELSALTALTRLAITGGPAEPSAAASPGAPNDGVGADVPPGNAGAAAAVGMEFGMWQAPAGRGGAADVTCREPHMHFVATLLNLQELRIRCLESKGFCFTFLTGLRLRTLLLEGRFLFTQEGVAHLAACAQHALESLKLMTCRWDIADAGVRVPPASGGSGSSSSSSWRRRDPRMQHPPPGVHDLLSAISVAMPQLTSLELGNCDGLTAAALDSTVRSLRNLRHLRLHQQPLPHADCAAVLGPSSLRYFESVQSGRAPDSTRRSPTGLLRLLRQWGSVHCDSMRDGGGSSTGVLQHQPTSFILTRYRNDMVLV